MIKEITFKCDNCKKQNVSKANEYGEFDTRCKNCLSYFDLFKKSK